MNNETKQSGFTLIELMVTLVVAMVVLGGLMLNFASQNSEYKYQSKRIDAVQDLEFAIKFIAEDLRGALQSAALEISIAPVPPSALATTSVDFYVWDVDEAFAASKRAHRKYVYDSANKTLKYDREIDNATVGGAESVIEILPNVTFFKVFNDTAENTAAERGDLFSGIPSAQTAIDLINPAVTGVPGYTILIEVEVDAGYKNGSFVDVLGNNVGIAGHKRIWRYIQVQPKTSVE